MKKSLLVSILLNLILFTGYAQVGTDFWFAAPEVTVGHNDAGPKFRFTNTSAVLAATVTVTQPANVAFVITPTPIVIPANGTYTLVLDQAPNSYKALIENTPTNTILNKGIHITSDVPIVAYYEVDNNNNNEIFALKGANSLGTEFYIPITQNSQTLGTLYNMTGLVPIALSTFDIVATQNATTVLIYSRVQLDGPRPANIPFTIVLNQGQTYSGGWSGANYQLAANQPSGAVVVSDKPIAITVKEDSKRHTGFGCYDLIGDQIVPVDIIGTDYIIMKGQVTAGAGESFFVLATQNNTKVYIDGNPVAAATLFAGQTYFQDNIVNPRYYIHTDKPVYCTQVTGFGCELGSALLPPLNCAGSRSVNFVRSTNESFYLNIMVKAGNEGNFTLTGGSNPLCIVAADFAVVPGTGGLWVSTFGKSFTLAEVPLATTMKLSNATDVFGMGLINGAAATGCRYGFFSEFVGRIFVNAGPDQNPICRNTNLLLAGSVTGGALTGIWTTTGTGSFVPDNITLNAQYVPSATDGVETFTLTSTSACTPVTDNMIVTFTPAPVVNAGPDQAAGSNNANVTLAGSVTVATGGIWSGGAGTYNPNNTTLNAVYTPSAAEILTGTVTLTLTSTGNGVCNAELDQMTITISPAPVVNAGIDQTVCANNANVTLNGTVTGITTTGIWSGGAGIFNPGNTALTVIYTPTAAEILATTVTLTLTSTNNGPCAPVIDQMIITITTAPTANAGIDLSSCGNNPNVTLNGSVIIATGGSWSGGLGTYVPNSTTLNAVYTPSVGEITLGTATLTLTTTGNGLCNAVTDNVAITVNPTPVSNAGVDQIKCSNNALTTLTGSVTYATGGIWSGGAGTYNPNNTTLNAIYTPTAAELTAGSVFLTLTTTGNGLCNAVADQMQITFTSAPVVGAGADQSKCSNNAAVLLNASVTVASGGIWSGGAGTYNPDNTALNAIYTPTVAEIAGGSLALTLTSTGNGTCTAVADVINLTFTVAPTANAGVDQTKCGNNAVATLNGSVTLATGGQWSGGLGTFTPSSISLTPTYNPTAAEISAGTVTLILTTTGNGTCNAVTNDMVISYTAIPTVNAGVDQSVCANSSATTLNGSVTVATGGSWSGGGGTYAPNNTTLNAVYTPSAAERTAGTVTLTLTSTGNGTCTAVTDQMTITITSAPTVNAGIDQSVCSNNPAVVINGSVTVATGGSWSGGSGTYNPNNTSLNITYTPTAGELVTGYVDLTLTTTGNGTCVAVTDVMRITYTVSPTVSAGIDQTKCGNSAVATLNGSVTLAIGGQWSGGLGTFTPSNTSLTPTYTPTAGEITTGSVTLTLTTTGNGTCNAVTDNLLITYTASPTASAGVDQTVCANNSVVTLNGSVTVATGGTWSGGSGTFTPNNTTLNATYTPTAAEKTAGTVTLTLTTSGNGTCNAVNDQMIITITTAPTASAGTDLSACSNNAAAVINGSITVASGGIWSGGSGSYNPNNTSLNITYTPTAGEISTGNVTLTLTTTGNGTCTAVSDNMIITYTASPTANAGIDQTKCGNNAVSTLAGAVTVASGGSWSGGGGTFTPNNTTLNATYTPTAGEITTGNITLTLTTTGNGTCTAVTDNMLITYTVSPTASAGVDQTVCANNSATTLNGSVTVATGGTWSGGGGTYAPNNTTLNAVYTPSVAERTAGTVTLTLTSTGNGTCSAVTDQMTITITTAPTASAGIDQSVCSNNAAAVINGSITIASGGIWSGGSGTYNPNNTSLNITYTPTAGEISTGNVTLTLTTTGNGTCTAVSDNMIITYTASPTANAGIDQTKCGNNAVSTLAGAVTIATGGSWSGGGGTFTPNNTTLNATYTPTAGEITTGNITLTLTTTGNGTCTAVTDNMLITYTASPTASAGVDQTVCANNSATTLNGSVTVATGGIWSGGGGTYAPNNTTLNAVYTPSVAERTAGTVTLTLTSTGNGTCTAVTDQMIITITTAPTVNAGVDKTVCANNPSVTINSSVTIATGGIWSGGTGAYNPGNTALNTIYTPTAAEITAGTITLTLTSTGNGTCSAVTDNMIITINPAPTANAGIDQIVCGNNAITTLNGIVTVATGGAWSGGLGTFTPNSTTLTATYTPTAGEITTGSVTLTITTTGNGLCNSVSDNMQITFTPAPTVNAGVDQIKCANNSATTLNGSMTIATGGIWSGGTGTYAPNNTSLNSVYTPSAADISAGTVTLTLTTTTGLGTCSSVTDQMTISITTAPTVSAGVDKTVCANNPATVINGFVAIATGGIWSGGSGTFDPLNTAINIIYTPTAGEISTGSVTLTLTSTGNGTCNAVSDNMIINITSAPTANAGIDQTKCGNNEITTLNGSVLVATGGSWSGGLGSFTPNSTTLNAAYTPTAGEISTGNVTLTLTTTGNGTCNSVSDNMLITLTTAPTINAGINQTKCANNSATTLSGSVTIATGGQWAGGGTFAPNNTTLNAVYTPSAAEITAGTATLLLTSTGNGTCNQVTSSMIVTITAIPTVNAGIDQIVCANNPAVTLNASETVATGVIWSGGSGAYNPSNTTLNTIYTPTAAEISTGTVNLLITTSGNGLCNAVTDNLIITINPAPVANAGPDQAKCSNNANSTLNGSVAIATGGQWSGGLGVFAPDNSTLSAVYTPTATELSNGTVTLILTTTGNGLCTATSDNMVVTFSPAPTVNAGIDKTVCANNSAVTLNSTVTVSTGGIWSGGTGTYNPNNTSLNTIYTPSAAEIATGNMVLTLTTTGNGTCTAVSDNVTVTINASPVVNAGTDRTSCVNNANVTLNGSITGASGGTWSGGSGSFNPNSTDLSAVYSPSAAEITAGSLSLTLTSTGNGTCNAVSDIMNIVIAPTPVVNAGIDQTKCTNNPSIVLAGAVSGATGGIWSGGLGIFNPSNTTLNATYTPSVAEIAAGTLTLTLTSSGNGSCNPISDNVFITFTPSPTSNSGTDQTVCGNNPTAILNGSVTIASGGQWSGGTGVFAPDNTTLNATYTPSVAEVSAGSANLVLTTTGNGTCLAVTDNILINITSAPVSNAGFDISACNNNATVSLNGSVNNATGGIWTGGAGSYNPANTNLTASYTPTAAEITAGTLILTLTTTGNGSCFAASDQVLITFTPKPTANANIDKTVCSNNPNTQLNGSVTLATGGIWSGGLGLFSPNNTTLNAVYTPSAGEIAAGNLTLILTTTGNGNCSAEADFMINSFSPSPTISAGLDLTVCANNNTTNLNGSFTVATGGIWSGGAGVFTPNNTSLTPTYAPTVAEISAGSVTLVFTSTGNGSCNAVSDNMAYNITPSPLVNAGTDRSACINNPSVTLNASVTGATGGIWSGGLGIYNPANTDLNATYTPTAAEISSGSMSLTLTSTGNGLCNASTDIMGITFNPIPTVNAGLDVSVCANNPNISLSGNVTLATGGQWTGGSGTYFPNSASLNTTYTPSASEITAGTVTLTLTSTGNGNCNGVSDNITITITTAPTANAGVDQTVCANNINVVLNGLVTVATGGQWSGGLGTYVPSNISMNATYTPTAAEVSSGIVTLTLATTGNGSCTAVTDNIIINIAPTPIVNAGFDQISCANNASVILSGSVTNAGGGIWSGSTGLYNPGNTSMAPTYSPSAAEITAGSVSLTLTSTGNGGCLAVTDNVLITINPSPVVDAGADAFVCSNNPSFTLNGVITNATGGIWSGGSGSFTPSITNLTTVYTPTPAEIFTGGITLTLTSTGNGNCIAVNNTIFITFTPSPTADAGSNQSVCANNPNIYLSASTTVATGGLWSGGSGTFNPDNTSFNAVYTPTATEISNGTVTLALTTTGNGNCIAVSDNMTVNITGSPTVNAGPDNSSCVNNPSLVLAGSVTNATGGQWLGGSGVFNPSNTSLTATYTPSAGELVSGSITLTLLTTGNGNCNFVSDNVTFIFNPSPIINAGTDNTLCTNNSSVTLNATVTNATGGQWSGGLGTFNPGSNLLNTIYNPSVSEITAGSATLILTSTGNGNCNPVTDNILIIYTPSPTANAGTDKTVCANNTTVTINGGVTVATGGLWSGGSGIFNPNITTLNITYTPTAAEIASGTATLTLTTTGNGNCLPVSDNMIVTISSSPIVSAGSDQNVCLNNSVFSLTGSVTNAGGGIWTGGSGVFNPGNTALTPTYTPTAAEMSFGVVNLTLTSTGNGSCLPVNDVMAVSFNAAPVVSAGIDQALCSNNPVIQLSGVVSGASGGQWSGGLGLFTPSSTTLNATYTPTAGEIIAGGVTLVLTSTGNGNCNAVSDNVFCSFTTSPTVDAGAGVSVCANNSSVALNGNVNVATGGIWSGGIGTFNPNNTTLNAIYTPTAAEITAGTVTLTLTTTGNGNCFAVSDQKVVTITASPIVNAGSNQTICPDNLNVSLNGSVSGGTSTGSWSTSGTGSFIPSTFSLNAVYTASSLDSSNQGVNLILTSTNNVNCIIVTDTIRINIYPAGIANAGIDRNVCANNSDLTLNGSVSGGAVNGEWSTSGSGTFTPSVTSLNAVYHPGSSDIISGNIILTLLANSCNMAQDNLLLTITPAPVVNAGANIGVCINNPDVSLNGSVTVATGGIWSGGSGTFNPGNTTLNATYTPTAGEISTGQFNMFLTSTGNGSCIAVVDTVRININPPPVVNAGIDKTVCGNNAQVTLAGSVTGATTTGQWTTSGSGTFSPDASTSNAIYVPSQTDITNGTVNLTLTSTNNGGCTAVSDMLTITITLAPTADAGSDVSVCGNNSTVSLNGVITIGTGVIWSTNGSGTFVPNVVSLNPTYFPSSADTASGTVVITLSTTGNGNCLAASDNKIITLIPPPKINAGADIISCVDNLNISLSGQITGITSTGLWTTTGTGSFTPNNSELNATYRASSADSISGSVYLTLTSTNNGNCNAVTDVLHITIAPAGIVNAGVDRTVCANNSIILLNGSITGGATKGKWTSSGTGTFIPNDSTLNASYVSSQSDTTINNIILTLTATNSCNTAFDNLTVHYTQAPNAYAGVNQTLCSNNSNATLSGVIGVATGGLWSTSGSGFFIPNNTSLNAIYVPSVADINLGSSILTLTTTNNGTCNAALDNTAITYTPKPIVDAGVDQTVCVTSSLTQLIGLVSGGATTGQWTTLGNGNFIPSNTTLYAYYEFSAEDKAVGFVKLVLTSTNNGNCITVVDTMKITFGNYPFTFAGYNQTVCANNLQISLNGVVSGGSTTGTWTSSGSGTFFPDVNSLSTSYYFSQSDSLAGGVSLYLTSTNNGSCLAGKDTIQIAIELIPTVNAGANQSICHGTSNVSLSGTSDNTTGIQWSTDGSGTFNPNNQNLFTNYLLTPSDSIDGIIHIYLSSTGNIGCSAAKDTITVTYQSKPIVNTGIDQTICSNSFATLAGSVSGSSTTGIWTGTGSGTFNPNNTTFNAQYTPSVADGMFGSVYLILASTNNGSCGAVKDTMRLVFESTPTVNAGIDIYTCAGRDTFVLVGNITNAPFAVWTTSGSGVFIPNAATLNAGYYPSLNDSINGVTTLTLTSPGTSTCGIASDALTLNFSHQSFADAGTDQNICASIDTIQLNGLVLGGTSAGSWTTSGTGNFVPDNQILNAQYKLSFTDSLQNSIQFILTTSASGNCLASSDTMMVYIEPVPVIFAGDNYSSCAGRDTILSTATASNSPGILWASTGTGGLFIPNSTTLTAGYFPSIADSASGSVNLILSSTGTTSCAQVNDTMLIIFGISPLTQAGTDLQICASTDTIQLNGSVNGGSVTGLWTTTGTGTFLPDSITLNSQYILSSGDSVLGNISLILTSTNNGNCAASADSFLISIEQIPFVNAGFNISNCADIDTVFPAATSFNTSGILWTTTGTGTFIPNSTSIISGYLPSITDSASGSIYLILTSTGNIVCPVANDSIVISYGISPFAQAGTDLQICASSDTIQLNGIISGGSGTGQWTTIGSGTFLPDSTTINCQYILSSGDSMLGSINFILTSTNNGNCVTSSDTVILSVEPIPSINAGADILVCSGIDTIMPNATAINTLGVIWSTSGSGIFIPNNNTVNAGYLPSIADSALGTVTLILSSSGTVMCNVVKDSLIFVSGHAVTVNSGVDQQLCASSDSISLNGIVTGGATTGQWTASGPGLFSPDNNTLTAIYNVTGSDSLIGGVIFTLISTGNGLCPDVTDTMHVSLMPLPVIQIGNDAFICSVTQTIPLSGTAANVQGLLWTTTGTGFFTPNNTTLNATYNLSSSDSASTGFNLALTSTGDIICNQTSDTMVITIGQPLIPDFGYSTTCINQNINFSDSTTVVTGNITNWEWDFGNGNIFNSQNTTFSYSTLGSYDVKLSVTSSLGCVYTIIQNITINPLPIANFLASTECYKDSVQFTDNSTISSGTIVSWNWEFGDDSTSTFQNPEHLYLNYGTYNVKLTVSSSFGCFANSTIQVPVYTSPVATFGYVYDCLSTSVTFTDNSLSQGNPLNNWAWTFGDGGQSATQNPVHSYQGIGNYTVQLIVASTQQCADTITNIINVNNIIGGFRFNNGCINSTISFIDTSRYSGGIINLWNWNFGDGLTSSSPNPYHSFNSSGSFDIRLIVSSTTTGCSDTLIKSIEIYPQPVAAFNIIGTEHEMNVAAEFSNVSTGSNAWVWNFGDNTNNDTLENPLHTFTSAGSFNVMLIAENQYSCTDSTLQAIIVLDNEIRPPKAPTGFSPNGDGKNDLLFVKGGPFTSMVFKVYNKWGLLVFETNDPAIGWNGKKDGVDQPIGEYVWTIKAVTTDGYEYTKSGNVTLIR